MAKPIICIVVVGLLILIMFGLLTNVKEEPIMINIDDGEKILADELGEFIRIGKNISYDPITKNVYIKNYTNLGYNVYTPYYSPNGKIYKYDVDNNILYEESKNANRD